LRRSDSNLEFPILKTTKLSVRIYPSDTDEDTSTQTHALFYRDIGHTHTHTLMTQTRSQIDKRQGRRHMHTNTPTFYRDIGHTHTHTYDTNKVTDRQATRTKTNAHKHTNCS